jgi:hypothetical protein
MAPTLAAAHPTYEIVSAGRESPTTRPTTIVKHATIVIQPPTHASPVMATTVALPGPTLAGDRSAPRARPP